MEELCVSQSAQLEETLKLMMENKENFRCKKINIFEAPEFTQRLTTFLEMETGKSATFVGYYRSTPPPTVTWVREDQVLNNTDKHIIVTDQTSGCSILTITHVNRKDEGPYKCRLENKEGVASSTGYLSIIASKNRRSKKKGCSAARVSSPPVLKSIIEQCLVEEKEEKEYVKMPPSPLNEFIAAIRHSAHSMNSAINYGNLENVPEEIGMEELSSMDKDVFNGMNYQRNEHLDRLRKKQLLLSDDEMSGGESSENEFVSKKPHYSSLSQLLGLDSVSQTSTGLKCNNQIENGYLPSHQHTSLGNPTERSNNNIRITTASRKDPPFQPKKKHSTDVKPIASSASDKLDLYMKTNNLSNLISPKITASRPQQLEVLNCQQQKQMQKLQQIQDFKLQKQQLRLQHQQLQEQLKKQQENKLIEKSHRSDFPSSDQRPLKLNSSNTTLLDHTVPKDSDNFIKTNPIQMSTQRRGSIIEIKEVSRELKDSFSHPVKSVLVQSSLRIPAFGCQQTNSNHTNKQTNSNKANSSIIDELVCVHNPFFYLQLSVVIAVSLAALATNTHPCTVVVVVALASLLAFSQIPQLIYSYGSKYFFQNNES